MFKNPKRLMLRAICWTAFALYELRLLQHQYQIHGTSWHFLVHSMIGVGLGLSAATFWTAHKRQAANPWVWGLVGQLVSMLPDFMFIILRMPHDPWMDVFVGHISIHTSPAPLIVSLVVFSLGIWSWYCGSVLKRYRLSLTLAGAAIILLLLALSLHRALPSSLHDLMRYESFTKSQLI